MPSKAGCGKLIAFNRYTRTLWFHEPASSPACLCRKLVTGGETNMIVIPFPKICTILATHDL